MIIVQGWVKMPPEAVEAMQAAAAVMVAETLKEPGCLDYSFAVDLVAPGTIRISELWVDDDALSAHFATPHMARFNAAMAGAKATGASVKAYTAEHLRTLMGS